MPAFRPLSILALTAAIAATGATLAWAGQPMIPAGGPTPATEGPIPIPSNFSQASAAPTPAPPAPTDPFIRDLLAKLKSEDPAQRDAAQKQLVSIAGLMQQPEILKKLQDVSTDQDLKDFFASRITQLRALEEEKRLTNLPPITLKLTNASIFQVATELNKALATPTAFMSENNGNLGNGRSFTIDATDKPFWEVFSQLQDQQYIEIQNYGNGQPPRLILSGARKSPYTVIQGPAYASIAAINYGRSVNFQSPPNSTQPPNMNISFSIAVDPRIHATRLKTPANVKVTDDEGRTLQAPNNGGGYNNGNGIIFGMSISMIPPDRLGKSISVSFDSGISTTVGDTKMAIDDIAANADKPITMGTRVVRITNVNFNNPNNANMTLNIQPVDGNRGINGDEARLPYSILDSTGRVLYSSSMSFGGSGFGFQTSGTKPPYKMEFSVPGRSVDIPLHFDFKEVPLP